jgi:putative nucleotidyltransferase with HDIG domain
VNAEPGSSTNDTCLKHIDIDQLAIGMFIEDAFDENGLFLISAGHLIEDQRQIERLKSRNVKSVFINDKKGLKHPTEPRFETTAASKVEREKAYYQELQRAKEVHSLTVQTVHETLNSLRVGKSFSSESVKVAAEEIVSSIVRNPDALISLSQIKGYDEYTYTHSVNVGIIAASLAHFMGYHGEDLLHIGMGGVLHDIGKMRVPESILNKPGKLTSVEFGIIKKHPQDGLTFVQGKKDMSEIVYRIIAQHHERFNGSGYPYGLKEGGINEIGVISAVADVYDALTSDRVYREAWTPQKALATIFQGINREFAQNVVELFTKHLGIYPVGSFVKLQNGEMGIVMRVDHGNLLAPIILILFDDKGSRLKEPLEYDLNAKQQEKGGDEFKIIVSLNPKLYQVQIGDYLQGTILT